MSTERHVLVTAGPTREAIDPVRYLSNESSGRMGFAIAEAAVKAGHRATLIAGPVDLPTPKGVERVDVVSARDMLAALEDHFPRADALYMAAAVADYRPAHRHAGKWKVKEAGADAVSLELVRNPDLVRTIARTKGERRVIAFALETSDGERRALEAKQRQEREAEDERQRRRAKRAAWYFKRLKEYVNETQNDAIDHQSKPAARPLVELGAARNRAMELLPLRGQVRCL